MAEVGIIMGSRSDWETMRHAAEMLDALEVAHETKVVSAHRTPERLYDYARNAAGRGLKVIIAGAGDVPMPAWRRDDRLPCWGTVQSKALAASQPPFDRPMPRGRWRRRHRQGRAANPAFSPPDLARPTSPQPASRPVATAYGGVAEAPDGLSPGLHRHVAEGARRMLAMAAAGSATNAIDPVRGAAATGRRGLHPRRVGEDEGSSRFGQGRRPPPTSSRISPPLPPPRCRQTPLHPPSEALGSRGSDRRRASYRAWGAAPSPVDPARGSTRWRRSESRRC